MRTCFKILILLLLSQITYAQQHLPDSIILALQHATNDSLLYRANREAYDYFEERNKDSALNYAEKILLLAQKNNKKLIEAVCLDFKGYQLSGLGKYAEALPCFLQAFIIAEDPKNENNSWLTTPLSPYKNRLLILSLTHHLFGVLMGYTQNIEQLIFHTKEAKRVAEQVGGPYGEHRIFLANMNLGSIYTELNKLDSALMFEKEAKDLALKTDSKKYLGSIIENFANIALKKGDEAKAKQLYYEAIQIDEEQSNLTSLAIAYLRLSNLYLAKNEKDSSLGYSIKLLKTLKSLGAVSGLLLNIGVAYENIYQSYRLQNQPDSALKYAGLALIAKDSISKRKIASLAEFQSLSLREQLRLQNLEKEKEVYQNKIRMYSLLAGLVVALFIALILYRNNKQKHKANSVLEKTLRDLKSTQSQLIQSEKMASLGELTAGIAHEIQNPLNFVNNFSEVNVDLLAEMKDEIDKGNTDEAKEIANDVIANEQKINHHGKRADAIVKGMLQHSRTSTGQKELTDINALADEYLRLSYHGLRAKDKTFNATMKTDFDESIGKVNIIPQDIGRVLLNLFNNAFYAVNARLNESFGQEQKSRNLISYQPTVSVRTSLNPPLEGRETSVLITVSDNGYGIPQNIVDKIFQPFFTTKPTGEGTGLGLSLAYDIVKAHGGDLKVETKANEGSTFIIQLPIV